MLDTLARSLTNKARALFSAQSPRPAMAQPWRENLYCYIKKQSGTMPLFTASGRDRQEDNLARLTP